MPIIEGIIKNKPSSRINVSRLNGGASLSDLRNAVSDWELDSLTLTGNLVVDGSLTAGSLSGSLDFSNDIEFTKESAHAIYVLATTTAATAGGALTVTSGAGSTSGAGGDNTISGGAAGATGTGGGLYLASGAGGATSGASGLISISSAPATVGSSGTVTVTSGNTASGLAGDIILTTGTHTSTTVVPVVALNKAVTRGPSVATVASGGTITGPELVGGWISATGATGNWTLPDTADITTALGSSPIGTTFDFVVDTTGVTGTNVVTLVVGANMAVLASPIITGSDTLTITEASQTVGIFRVTFVTATTTTIVRLA